MRIGSFRVRIALWSVFCSSLVLLGFSLFAWNIIWRTEIRRIDGFLSSDVQRRLDVTAPSESELALRRGPPREGQEAFLRLPPWQRPPMPPPQRTQTPASASPALSFVYWFRDLTTQAEIRSDNWPESLSDNTLATAPDLVVRRRTVSADGRLWRLAVGRSPERSVIIGIDLAPTVALVRQAAGAFLLSIPVALVLIAFGAIFMARRALRPILDLTQTVKRITASGLGERVASPVRDAEFEKLIRVFNQMMDRLERSFAQANRFSADAAHELRTPLSIVQGHMERMLQAAEPGSDAQQDLGDMLEEMHRIKSILEKLLLLAQMEAGQVQLHMAPLDLAGLLGSVVEDLPALAPAMQVEARIEPGIQVDADQALLETAIQNLASNAVKYNLAENGRVAVELTKGAGRACLAVSNTGPKIADADRERVFERFYRSDKSRSRQIDGTGLGLSLAREIVQAHGGTLRLAEAPTDNVNRFEIVLPLSVLPPVRVPARA